MGKEQKLGL